AGQGPFPRLIGRLVSSERPSRVLQDDSEPRALGNELRPSLERVRASDEIEDEIALNEPVGERAGGIAVRVEAVEDPGATQPTSKPELAATPSSQRSSST